jgi:hypothetical protein
MPSPFPGMDPYLERRDLWPDFHSSLAVEIRNELNRILPSRYLARTEYRFELDIYEDDEPMSRRQIVADVGIARDESRTSVARRSTLVELPRRELSEEIEIFEEVERIRRAFVEIHESAKPHRLITVVEIVSPSNKRPGSDRASYLARRREILAGDANFVEIDLLRSGDRVFSESRVAESLASLVSNAHYLVLISRSWRRSADRFGFSIVPIGIRDILPCIAIPLRSDEEETPLGLQYVFQRVYDTGPYLRGEVDYAAPPDPPLEEIDAAWANALLKP